MQISWSNYKMFKAQFISVFFVSFFALSSVYGTFDYMQLVLQWPPMYCRDKSCQRIPRNFTVHGLWPDNNQYQLNNCKINAYNKLKDVREQSKLDDRWQDLTSTKSMTMKRQRFWEYEYNKHGTCCDPLYNQQQYFNLTMNLKDKFDLLRILRNHGIVPGSTSTIKGFGEAIETVTKVFPNLKCIDNNGIMELLEVGICFDPGATKVIPCHRPWICHADENTMIELVK